MTNITLESIKAEQTKLAEKIAAFEQQQVSALFFPEATIKIAAGERFAGLIVGKDGEPSYYLILLPGQANDINWKDAQTWAKGQGGELPTRREQSLLFANLKEQCDPNWYWSSDTHESDSAYAWCQLFYNGCQNNHHKLTTRCRASAVRRLIIE